MVMNKFLTEKERKRAERDARLRCRYAELKKAYPDLTTHRIALALSREFNLSVYRIYQLIKTE